MDNTNICWIIHYVAWNHKLLVSIYRGVINERVGDGILAAPRNLRGINDAIDRYYINFSGCLNNWWS